MSTEVGVSLDGYNSSTLLARWLRRQLYTRQIGDKVSSVLPGLITLSRPSWEYTVAELPLIIYMIGTFFLYMFSLWLVHDRKPIIQREKERQKKWEMVKRFA